MTVIRLPPSGPPITNAGGAALDFGPGAVLRSEDDSAIIPTSPVVLPVAPLFLEIKDNPANALAPFMRASIANPRSGPGVRYRCTAQVVFDNPLVTAATGLLRIEVSADNGATWLGVVGENRWVLYPTQALTAVLTSVSGPLPAGSATFMIRALAAAADAPSTGLTITSPAPAVTGTTWIRLEELF